MKKILLIVGLCLTVQIISFSQCSNPYAGEDFAVCGMSANLNVTNATTGHWSAFINEEQTPANFYPNDSATDVIVTIPYFSEHYSPVNFIWTDDSGPCPDTINVIFAKMPVSDIGEINIAEICGNVYNLNADTTGNGWAEFAWNSPLVAANFSDSNLPDAEAVIDPEAFGDSAHVAVPFVWTVSNYSCVARDTMWVTFYQLPQAYAGEDIAVCGNNYTMGTEFNISQSENYSPSGVWSYYSGPAGESCNFSSTTNVNANVIVSQTGIWSFIFRENNSLLTSCYSKDTVQIEFVEIPIANAGQDFDVCGNCVQLGYSSAGYNGMWLLNWSEIENMDEDYPFVTVCVSSYGTRTFVWQESTPAQTTSLLCQAQDSVDITFWRKPTANILTDPADSIVCGNTFENLLAEEPATGNYGYWWSPSTYCFTNDSETSCAATIIYYGYNDFYWIEKTAPFLGPEFCADTAGPLTINFLKSEPLFAGCDASVSGHYYTLNATSVAEYYPGSDCVYQWENESAFFADASSLQTTVVVYEFGVYEFVLNSYYVNLPDCYDSDTVKINFIDPDSQGIENENAESLKIFPNPAKNVICLDFDYNIIEKAEIFDLKGDIQRSVISDFNKIDISTLEQGVYFIRVFSGDAIIVKKFMKE